MIRVLVVDDSAFLRRQLVRLLQLDGDIQVVGEAGDGLEAQQLADELSPDLITLDVEMPRCNGLDALRGILQKQQLPVLMLSSLTSAGAETTIAALRAGAVDFLHKGSSGESVDWIDRANQLREKIRFWARYRRPSRSLAQAARGSDVSTPELLLIGCSSGGPKALAELLRASGPLPYVTVIAQHMPPVYTRSLAATLQRLSGSPVHEVGRGEELTPGCIYIVPGGQHGELFRAGGGLRMACHNPEADEVAPSVDRLFGSAVGMASKILALVLSGMGRDGAHGAQQLRQAGHRVWVQDPVECVVAGMPGAVLRRRAHTGVMTVEQMRSALFAL